MAERNPAFGRPVYFLGNPWLQNGTVQQIVTNVSRSEIFPRMRFHGCPGVRKPSDLLNVPDVNNHSLNRVYTEFQILVLFNDKKLPKQLHIIGLNFKKCN
jgi:hypothetical protein